MLSDMVETLDFGRKSTIIKENLILTNQILILRLRKQFSSTFLLLNAFLEKTIGLTKTKIPKKNLSSLF